MDGGDPMEKPHLAPFDQALTPAQWAAARRRENEQEHPEPVEEDL